MQASCPQRQRLRISRYQALCKLQVAERQWAQALRFLQKARFSTRCLQRRSGCTTARWRGAALFLKMRRQKRAFPRRCSRLMRQLQVLVLQPVQATPWVLAVTMMTRTMQALELVLAHRAREAAAEGEGEGVQAAASADPRKKP